MNNIEHLHGDGGDQEDTCPACTGLHYIDGTELKASIASLDSMLLEMRTEHMLGCEGFVLVDAGMDSEKKTPCDICWPDGFVEPDRDGEDR